MTLATFAALDALADALIGVEGLPVLKRHDSALDGFDASGTDGVKFKLVMLDGGSDILDVELGPDYELASRGEIIFAVEGDAGDARNAVLRAGVEALAGVMFPGGQGLAIAGKFEDFRVIRIDRRLIQQEAGRAPIDLLTIEFSLFVTAPTPFG